MYRALCWLRALLQFLHPCLLTGYIFIFFTGIFLLLYTSMMWFCFVSHCLIFEESRKGEIKMWEHDILCSYEFGFVNVHN